MARKILLLCGILSSLLYVGINVLGAMQWKNYSSTSQSVSELMAIDAPSRPLVVPLFIVYDVLLIAFGLGVWRSADRKRALQFMAVLLVGIGVIGLVAAPFAPIHLRGIEGSLTDRMHIILTMGIVLFTLLAIGIGATAFGKRFRFYSIATIVVLLVFGTLAGLDGPRLAAQLPTPWLGVTERINIGGYLLWVLVLAVNLLQVGDRATASVPRSGSSSG
jgi:hypothetical protein